MQVRKIATLPVAPSRARFFVQKAREVHALVEDARERKLWYGVALLSLELTVLLADALLIRERGFRPRSGDPRELPELLARELPYLPDIDEAVAHARRVMVRAGALEREPRPMARVEACTLFTHADAFRVWSLGLLE